MYEKNCIFCANMILFVCEIISYLGGENYEEEFRNKNIRDKK